MKEQVSRNGREVRSGFNLQVKRQRPGRPGLHSLLLEKRKEMEEEEGGEENDL